MAKHIGATHGVKLGHAVFFDLLLAFEAQLFLHFDFDGQAVRIPAAAPQTVVALHHFVARKHVLKGARHDVMAARRTIGRGRAFVKDVARRVFTPFRRALKDAVVSPEIQLLLLQAIDDFAVDLRVYFPKHDLRSLHALDT